MNLPKHWERYTLIAILLLAWGLRWIALFDIPPGWRDDDLIELYTFSHEMLESGLRLYIGGASGHEPLFHALRAPWLAVAGVNQASARWYAAVFALFSVLLTWAIGRRMFSRQVGLLASALVGLSFWSLMYSRVAIRHVGVLPWALLALYWGWRALQDERVPDWRAVAGIALGTAGSLTTYYAGRLVPVLLLVALPLVGTREGWLWQPQSRPQPQRQQRLTRYGLGLLLGLLLVLPVFWTAIFTPGADARVDELAVPIYELLEGNPRPILYIAWRTLGMFHAYGDPEWLYNYMERPVFGPLGAVCFYASLALALARWRKPQSRWLLLWLGTGISPALISIPHSSYGHTILAQPATYLLLALPMQAALRRSKRGAAALAALALLLVAGRDLPDYFVRWNQHPMVHFLYRGDYRNLALYLNARPEIEEAVVGSFLFGPWDQLATETDLRRDDVALRWVNPERALVDTGEPAAFYYQDESPPAPLFAGLLGAAIEGPAGMPGYRVELLPPPEEAYFPEAATFNGALRLHAILWEREKPLTPGTDFYVLTWWEVTGDLPLPPFELIPNPPPPGVYSGSRLSVFAHLLDADGAYLTGDDGLWVDPYSLQPGDRVLQIQRFAIPADAVPGPYTLTLGLYDPHPEVGARWRLPAGEDQVQVRLE